MFGSERESADNSNEEAVRRQDRCKDPEPVDTSPEVGKAMTLWVMSDDDDREAAGGGALAPGSSGVK